MVISRSESVSAWTASFWSGLEETVTQALLAAAHTQRVPAKHSIVTSGHRATHFFVLQRGSARYCHFTKQGEVVLLANLVPGDLLGLMALLDDSSSYMATAEATTDCELLAWERPIIRKLVSCHPSLAQNALRVVLGYLKNSVERHVGLASRTAEERLAGTLLRLGHQSGRVRSDGVEIRVTNEQLSGLADVSPYTASRVLSDWGRAGAISKGRGKILLRAPEALLVN